MNDTKMINVAYLSKFLLSPSYFNKETGKFESIDHTMKAIFSFFYVNPFKLKFGESSLVAFGQAAQSLNLDDETCGIAVHQMRNAGMLRHYMIDEEFSCLSARRSKKIVLSAEIKLDAFLSTLPESYISHYLYIKHHSDIVDNKLTMTIEAISNATGVNGSEVGFMNKLFKEMGYFKITKEPKTGTNIYEVIK